MKRPYEKPVIMKLVTGLMNKYGRSPAYSRKVRSEIDGVPTYRLDFAYRRARVVVEYDGEEAHEGREAEDEERRAWLRRHGWTVIVVRIGDFTGEALDRWLDELRSALATAYSNRRW